MDWLVGIVLGVAAGWGLLVAVLWFARPRHVGLGALVRVVPDIARLGRELVADRTVPFEVRLALVLLLGWLVSPIDLIPEFVPVIGPVDDVVVAVLVLRFVRRRLGLSELRRRWAGSTDGFELLAGIVGSDTDSTGSAGPD